MTSRTIVVTNTDLVVERRRQKGLNQEDLAYEADVSISTVSKVESGKPVYLKSLSLVLKKLGLTVAEVIGFPREVSPADDERSQHDLLPARPTLFVGREKAIEYLIERFQCGTNENKCTRQAITSVRGWPGIGKSTLTAELAYRPEVLNLFPDGVLWTSLGTAPDVREFLSEWARALGDLECASLTRADEMSKRIAGVLRNQRRLLIVDDVWEAKHATPFCIGGSKCAILIATRITSVAEELTPSSDDIYRLDELSEEASLELLERVAGDAIKGNEDVCRSLVRDLEGLPLALQVAGKLIRAEQHRGISVASLLSDIRNDAKLLLQADAPVELRDLLSQSTPNVAALLRKSVDPLPAELRERFAVLGVFPPKPATFSVESLTGIWGINEREAVETVKELAGRGLMEPAGAGRYQVHSLLIALAKSLWEESGEAR